MNRNSIIKKLLFMIAFIFSVTLTFYSALTVLGFEKTLTDLFQSLPDYCQIIIAIFAFIMFAAYVIYYIRTIKTDEIDNFKILPKTLKINSKKYFDFFTRWYSNQGKICIYCSDMEWVTDNDLMKALIAKSNENNGLVLYIAKETETSKKLQRKGALVHLVKSEDFGTDKFSFSCRRLNNTESIILRCCSEDQPDYNGNGSDKIIVHFLTSKMEKEMIEKIKESIELNSI